MMRSQVDINRYTLIDIHITKTSTTEAISLTVIEIYSRGYSLSHIIIIALILSDNLRFVLIT